MISNHWIFDRDRLVLNFFNDEGRWVYDIDLERCRTSAQVLDWIMQVSKKSWATDLVIASLVRMLDEILDPQGSMCSFGIERGPINVEAFACQCNRKQRK